MSKGNDIEILIFFLFFLARSTFNNFKISKEVLQYTVIIFLLSAAATFISNVQTWFKLR